MARSMAGSYETRTKRPKAIGPSMTAAQATILDTIGNTSLLPLRHVVPANGARILLKLESENPTGSMKDRMALAMIEACPRRASSHSARDHRGLPGFSVGRLCAFGRRWASVQFL